MQNTVRFSSYFDTLHAIRQSCYSDNVYTLQKMHLLNIINFLDIENNILFESIFTMFCFFFIISYYDV